MANVAKLVEIIYGSNPSEDDIRAIIEKISERLPKPIVEKPALTSEPASTDEPAAKVAKGKAK